MLHFVLTRINQKWIYRDLHEDYLNYRIDLFLETCHMSLSKQTSSNFKHILICSPTLPEKIMNRMYSISNTELFLYDNPTQSQVPGECFAKLFNDRYLSGYSGVLCTTSLDSDDMIPIDYVEKVSKISEEIKKDANFPILLRSTGFFTLGSDFFNSVSYDRTPPFFSLLEKNRYNTSVITGHRSIHKKAKDILDINSPQIMLKHSANNYMSPRGKKPFKKNVNIDLRKYGIEEEHLFLFLNKKLSNTFKNREEGIRKNRRKNNLKFKDMVRNSK